MNSVKMVAKNSKNTMQNFGKISNNLKDWEMHDYKEILKVLELCSWLFNKANFVEFFKKFKL